MANELDAVTQVPIREWRLSPPAIVKAANGFVLRTYDVATDANAYTIATTPEDVRAALLLWVDAVAASLRSAIESEIEKAV